MRVGGRIFRAGDRITLDGTSGEVIAGEVPTIEPKMSGDFAELMGWADEIRGLGVRANAETPEDLGAALRFGAEGVGLCRTEHMFFEEDRIRAVREMILAEDAAARRTALDRIAPMQTGDFAALFRILGARPLTIRLLDPPLHELLPAGAAESDRLAGELGIPPERLRQRVARLREANPMLGHRGCRLGLSHPEIYEMQARAIFEAAAQVAEETGTAPVPEIMIPLVATREELARLRQRVDAVAEAVIARTGQALTWHTGTMIELPRAALRAGELAEIADFFSFGTNDLTQTAFGISRDDSSAFLPFYLETGLLARDPFVSLDREGVGELVRLGAERGRAARPGLQLGICGEHGGDPDSIAFCQEIGLDYVSASPYRVPIARLAAAQATLAAKETS